MESVLQRVAALEQALSNPASLLTLAARTGGSAAPAAPEPASAGGGSFAEVLQSATANGQENAASAPQVSTTAALPSSTAAAPSPSTGLAATATPMSVGPAATTVAGLTPTALTPALSAAPLGQGIGARIVAIAESQAGQAEQPPGSNESPAIAQYRTATAGAIPGAPWCAYFASWAARQAGAPLGANGEGLGSVSAIWSWAQSTGRAIPNGPSVTPQPGDLIVFGGQHVGIVKGVLPNGDIQTIEGNYENKVALNTRTPTEATGYVSLG